MVVFSVCEDFSEPDGSYRQGPDCPVHTDHAGRCAAGKQGEITGRQALVDSDKAIGNEALTALQI